MVDYHDKSYALDTSNQLSGKYRSRSADIIHEDNIGEYKSEFIKIQFDKTSAEVMQHIENLDSTQDIKRVDLNELGYAS